MVWIKYLITSHNSDEILCVRQVDNVVSPTRNHINRFNLISANLKFHSFPCVDISLLNQTMAMYNNELFPLGVVPMLPLGDSGLGNID